MVAYGTGMAVALAGVCLSFHWLRDWIGYRAKVGLQAARIARFVTAIAVTGSGLFALTLGTSWVSDW